MKRLSVLTLTLASALSFALGAQEISPVLFGQNHWLAQGDENRTGYLHLLWPQVKASGVQLIRIGGNAYEVKTPSLARWTAMVDSVQAIGAEPLLQVPRHFSAEEAAALVKHFNAKGRRPIRYWSIGNEPMLGDKVKVEEVYAYLMRIAPAMKAADPSIKILVSDEAWMRKEAYEAFCGGKLDLTGKNAQGQWLIDGFSYHTYPNGEKFDRAAVTGGSIESIRSSSRDLAAMIDKANAKQGRKGEERLRWALTEVNVTYANPDRDVEGIGNPSFLGGQFLAEAFGIGMEFGALTVAPWAISETDNPKTDFGYLGLPPDFAPRSSYYHEQLLAKYFKGSYLKGSSNQALVKVIGARSKTRIAVMLLNQELSKDLDFELALGKEAATTKALAVKMDAGLKAKLQGTIPAQTTQVFVFDAQGKLVEKATYGLAQNLRNQPPKVEKAH